MLTNRLILCSLLSLSLVTPLAALADSQCANSGKRELHFVFENDVFAEKLGLTKSDRWYTNGVKAIAKIKRDAPPWWYSKTWETLAENNPLTKQAPTEKNGIKPYCMEYGFTLGQMMYTPMNIKQSAPQVNDRFWGGWLYFGTILQSRPKIRENAARGELETFELDIGVVGPLSLAQQAQKTVHALIGAPTPAGWNNQLKSELGIQTTYSRAFTVQQAHNDLLGFDLAAHYGFGLGTLFDYVNAGATIRIGNNLSGAPVGTIENPSLMAFEQPDNRAYFLARIDAKASFHNTFIDGSIFRRDPHPSSVRSKPLVLQATVGMVVESKTYALHRFAFLFSRRSAEFNTPPGAASMQNFGTILMQVDF